MLRLLLCNDVRGDGTAITTGSDLLVPFSVCMSIDGEWLLSEPKCQAILAADPRSGATRVACAGGVLGVPNGLAAEPAGTVLVANGEKLIRFDPRTGAQSVAYDRGYLKLPLGVALGNDRVYVADAMGLVIRIDSASGVQTVIAKGGFLKKPQGIAVEGNDIYVTDIKDPAHIGEGRVIRVNPKTGRQRIIAEGGYLRGPVSIRVEKTGTLLVGDPGSIRPQASGLLEGNIVRIDPATGAQTLLGSGTLAGIDYSAAHRAAIIHQQFWVLVSRSLQTGQSAGTPGQNSTISPPRFGTRPSH